jgi:peptide/nickel transport system substrate-binding protein
VVIQAAADTSALKQMLEQGDVDLAWGLLNEQIAELRGNPDIAMATTPMLGFIALGMTADPARNEAVANPVVRQALKVAIDYEGIRSLQEGAQTPPSLVPIGLPGALDPATHGFTRDVEAAKSAIAEAGYPDGFSATLATSATEIIGGIALSLLAEKVQADLREVGIDTTLEVEDEEIFRPKYRAGDIDLVIGAWYVGYPNPFDLLDNWGPTGSVSIDRFRWDAPDHPAVALLAEARGTVDAEARDELVREAQLALQQDAPYTMLIQPVFSYPHRTTITGLVPNPTWNFDLSTISRV